MRLLQTEINAIPGNRPNRSPRPEGWVGDGTTTLVLTNTSPLENAYTIRLECENPYWQAAWYQITALPPDGLAENKPPVGKPDTPGPKNQTLKIYISTGGTRQVQIGFTLPKNSTARAGTYPFKVIVEASISEQTKGGTQQRITEIQGTLIVRPFFDTVIEVQPPDHKVGYIRRKARYEVVVRNRGNDWLYVDVKAGKAAHAIPTIAQGRIAVPPPEPGAESERSVPLVVDSKQKAIRAERKGLPVPFTVTRVEAPSIPPLPEEASAGGPANLGATVLAEETREELRPEEAATITYCPPIPSSFAEFMQSIVRNAKGLAMFAVGTFFLVLMTMTVYEREYRKVDNLTLSSPSNGRAPNGGTITLSGTWIKGAEFVLVYKDKSDQPTEVTLVPETFKQQSGKTTLSVSDKIWSVDLSLADANIKDATITKIICRRRMWLLGSALMPPKALNAEIVVGRPLAGATVKATVQKPVRIGQKLVITVNEGDIGEKGRVEVGGVDAKILSWKGQRIEVSLPASVEPGVETSVDLIIDGKPQTVDSFTIKDSEGVAIGEEGTPEQAAPSEGGPAPEVQVGEQPNSNPSTGTGTSAKGGNAGGSGAGSTVAGYDAALQAIAANTTRGYRQVADQVSGSDAKSVAVRAFVLAAAGKPDEASQALAECNPSSDLEKAYVLTAQGRIAEAGSDLKGAQKSYGRASKLLADAVTSGGVAPGSGALFPDLARAVFLRDVKSQPNEASALLKDASQGPLTEGEKAAIAKALGK